MTLAHNVRNALRQEYPPVDQTEWSHNTLLTIMTLAISLKGFISVSAVVFALVVVIKLSHELPVTPETDIMSAGFKI